MKGVIYYYSSTGNTKIACEYIAKSMKNITFDLIKISKNTELKLSEYDLVGFATSTDFFGPPQLVKTFLDKITIQQNKPAFVLNTYGLFSGKTLKILKDWVNVKGFKVIAGYSLQMPENFPPFIVKGITSKNTPKQKSLRNFDKFITELDRLVDASSLEDFKNAAIKIGFINSLFPVQSRNAAKKDMGEKYVDISLCNECGICKNVCPYEAIQLNPKPVFDMDECYGCWSCFNHCPNKAIYTNKIRGKGQYVQPIEALKEKLSN